jgi:hypothetical protein
MTVAVGKGWMSRMEARVVASAALAFQPSPPTLPADVMMIG